MLTDCPSSLFPKPIKIKCNEEKFNLQQLYWKVQLFLLTTYKKWCPLCMDIGWIHHYRKLLSGRGHVLNWELQKASQLAKRNKKYITKSTQTLVMIIPPHFERGVHKEEQACSKLEGYASSQWLLPCLCSSQEGLLNEVAPVTIHLTLAFVAHQAWKHAETMAE